MFSVTVQLLVYEMFLWVELRTKSGRASGPCMVAGGQPDCGQLECMELGCQTDRDCKKMNVVL